MWLVQFMGSWEQSYELSVVRGDNRHGQQSYGWGGRDKIILFGTGLGSNNFNPVREADKAFAMNVAQIVCDGLNEDRYPPPPPAWDSCQDCDRMDNHLCHECAVQQYEKTWHRYSRTDKGCLALACALVFGMAVALFSFVLSVGVLP